MLKKSVQQGRSKRRAEAYPLGYVEGLNDARTKLAEFFSTLLEVESYLRVGVTKMFADPHLLLVLAQ